MPTFSHTSISRTPLLERLRVLAHRLTVIRASELRKFGIHHHMLRRAVEQGFLKKLDRGLYTPNDRPTSLEGQIVLACKRVPRGVVCLESALRFHDILPSGGEEIWVAVDRKARRPTVKGVRLRFVRFSGDALTQGVVNTRIDGVPIRVYSVAKTI